MKLLDLFCGAGGCSAGYVRAGFDVVGVDIAPMPHYPYSDVIQGDAMLYLADRDFLSEFDVVHASPPCQAYSALRTRHRGREYADLVAPVRRALQRWGGPYVIENVEGAPLLNPTVLCGSMFGLGFGESVLKRHRLFETNFPVAAAPGPDACRGRSVVGVYGTGGAWTRTAPGGGGVKVSGADAAAALGVDWTYHQPVLAQMIPPAYTEHIGKSAIGALACPA